MSDELASLSTSELASRFRRYRLALRDRSGSPDPQLRSWAGPVHAVMSELGERLGAAGQSSGQVVSLLGEPDEVLTTGRHHPALTVPPGCEHLVYWWRGGHDYLYFLSCDGVIQSSHWFHAGE